MAVSAMNQLLDNSVALPLPELTNDECAVWQYWEAKFTRSTTDLLDDYVDPVEERHMDLLPDDEESRVAKFLSRKFYDCPQYYDSPPFHSNKKQRRSSYNTFRSMIAPNAQANLRI